MKFSNRKKMEPPLTAWWLFVELIANLLAILLFGGGIYYAAEFGSVIPIAVSVLIAGFLFWLPDRIRKRHQMKHTETDHG